MSTIAAQPSTSFPSSPGQPASPEVAVLGAAAVDWVARVETMPSLDGIAFADEYLPFPGGSGGNVAEAIARLGHGVRFLGRLGDDDGGALLLKAFELAGVDTSFIRVAKDKRSAACFIAVNRKGQRLIFALGGAALFDRLEDVRSEQLTGIRVLFIADAFPKIAKKAISLLQGGARVVFNPGGLMCGYGIEALRPILERTETLIVSRVEGSALVHAAEPEENCHLLQRSGPKNVVMTLGGEGALVYDGHQSVRVPAAPVEWIVDTTGAGDAFSAGMVCGLMEGLPLPEAARAGCEAAGRKIQHFGAREGLPLREQVPSLQSFRIG